MSKHKHDTEIEIEAEKEQEHCSCHEHHHEHEHEECSCHKHEHHHEHHNDDDGCCCGHHHHDEDCCGHDHHHHHDHHHDHDHDHDHDDDGCGCGCGCGHDHGNGEEKSGAAKWLRYILGAIPVIVGFLGFLPWYITIPASVIGYLIFGFEVWRGMIAGFGRRRIFTEFTLMCAATVGAFCIGEYADAAAVMFLYSLGETISDGAYSRSKKNISELLSVTPEYATVVRGEDALRVAPEEVGVGETILIVAGERVPLDGVVLSGNGFADTSSVTGEATPLELYEGVSLTSGSVLTDGSVRLKVETEYKNSVVARLAEAVKEASAKKSPTEKKISRFAAVFTPIAFAVATAVALVGGLITGNFTEWLKVGLSVLVISCPCSLVLSVPLTYFAGLGAGAKRGIIFKGGESVDGVADMSACCFDKTGTLTESALHFESAELFGDMDEAEFLSLSYDVLLNSPHAAAVSFCQDHRGDRSERVVSDVKCIGGRGVVCLVDGKQAAFGNAALMREQGMGEIGDSEGTSIFGSLDGVLLGRLDFSSRLKEGAKETVEKLRAEGVRVCLLSGDGEAAVRETAEKVGIADHYSRLTPDGKLLQFENIYNEVKNGKGGKSGTVAFCGDGLNDSAVVMRADVGIAMGKCGSALTVTSADLIIMDDSLGKLGEARRLAKRISGIAASNIALSLGIKGAILVLGIMMTAFTGKGIPMELAIVADVGAAVLAVLNALRASR